MPRTVASQCVCTEKRESPPQRTCKFNSEDRWIKGKIIIPGQSRKLKHSEHTPLLAAARERAEQNQELSLGSWGFEHKSIPPLPSRQRLNRAVQQVTVWADRNGCSLGPWSIFQVTSPMSVLSPKLHEYPPLAQIHLGSLRLLQLCLSAHLQQLCSPFPTPRAHPQTPPATFLPLRVRAPTPRAVWKEKERMAIYCVSFAIWAY